MHQSKTRTPDRKVTTTVKCYPGEAERSPVRAKPLESYFSNGYWSKLNKERNTKAQNSLVNLSGYQMRSEHQIQNNLIHKQALDSKHGALSFIDITGSRLGLKQSSERIVNVHRLLKKFNLQREGSSRASSAEKKPRNRLEQLASQKSSSSIRQAESKSKLITKIVQKLIQENESRPKKANKSEHKQTKEKRSKQSPNTSKISFNTNFTEQRSDQSQQRDSRTIKRANGSN